MKDHWIHIDEHGNKTYYKEDAATIHREDGPAVEWSDGSKEWYLNGKRHREDGPAFVGCNGGQVWYRKGKKHREGGPAVVGQSGTTWYRNGKLHREDGPAIEWSDGTRSWWLNDVNVTKKEHRRRTCATRRTQKVELTLNEIAEKLNIPVEKLRIKE